MRKETPKYLRLQVILDHLSSMPPAHSSLEAYKMLNNVINEIEDEFLGKDSYNPPRSLLGIYTKRMYVTNLESVFPVEEYSGVSILISSKHITFISRYGAIEVQNKLKDDTQGKGIPFKSRVDAILYRKHDAWGNDVWHEKNK